MTFTAWSDSFKPGYSISKTFIYNGNGCDGNNISPAIEWKNPPKATKSFAITVFDPDATRSGGWWHWAVVNIPSNIHKLEEGASSNNKLPKNSIELKTDFGEIHYGGPCPPKGDLAHHYVFTVYALKSEGITIDSNSTASNIKNILEQESLAKASFSAHYSR